MAPNEIRDWVMLIVPVAALIVSIWSAVNSAKLQRIQYKAAIAAQAAEDTPTRIRINWFKRSAMGFVWLGAASLAWLVASALFDEPITRLTLLNFSLTSMAVIFNAALVVVNAFVAGLAPISWLQN